MKYKKLKGLKTNFHSLETSSLPEMFPNLEIREHRRGIPYIQKNDIEIPRKLEYHAAPDTSNKSVVVSNADLATFFLEEFKFLNIEETLYHWNPDKGIYIPVSMEYADTFIRRNIPRIYRNKINSNTIKEIVMWIKSELYTGTSKEHLEYKLNLIAFSNGIFNIEKKLFISHSPEYFFTSVINAEYKNVNYSSGEYFKKFLYDITAGNPDFYLRLQELFGYVISEIRSVKYIPYLLGPKDTGKSIILKILEHLVGKDSYTNLSFDQLNKPEYLSQLLGKRLNTCGETSEFRLNKLDIFKKLSGGDHVTARAIYGQPINFVNSAVLLFAGNHLPTINGIDKSNAFSQRIIIFSFKNQISKSQQDPQLFEKLIKEKEYIVHWAIEGFIRWKENNFQFTSYEEVEEISEAYYEQNNSIDSFIKTSCDIDVDNQIYKSEFERSYREYCKRNDISPESNQVLHSYIKALPNINYKRYRDGQGNNKYGYTGITLKDEGF